MTRLSHLLSAGQVIQPSCLAAIDCLTAETNVTTRPWVGLQPGPFFFFLTWTIWMFCPIFGVTDCQGCPKSLTSQHAPGTFRLHQGQPLSCVHNRMKFLFVLCRNDVESCWREHDRPHRKHIKYQMACKSHEWWLELRKCCVHCVVTKVQNIPWQQTDYLIMC